MIDQITKQRTHLPYRRTPNNVSGHSLLHRVGLNSISLESVLDLATCFQRTENGKRKLVTAIEQPSRHCITT